jgi:hypothetical protein
LVLFLLTTASQTASAAAWQEEWQATVQAAKREGQVTVYISGYGATLDAGHFQKDFPEIKVVAVTGSSGQLGPRLLAERRAGKYLADVSSAGAQPHYQLFYASKILEPISSTLILPEVTDTSKWWGGKHWYIDPEGQYIFAYVGNMTGTGAYAVNTVNPTEFKSYWDFVNPKWKGKIVARDIRNPGPGGDNMRFFYHHPGLGPKFIHHLFSEMDLTLTRDFRQGIDWLAQGKFSLALFFSTSDVKAAVRQGLPVEVLDNSSFKEGVPEVGARRLNLRRCVPGVMDCPVTPRDDQVGAPPRDVVQAGQRGGHRARQAGDGVDHAQADAHGRGVCRDQSRNREGLMRHRLAGTDAAHTGALGPAYDLAKLVDVWRRPGRPDVQADFHGWYPPLRAPVITQTRGRR